MNILIFSQYYNPEQFLINEIAPQLVRRGHKVTVVTGLPNYPSGIIEESYRGGKRRHETIDGVEVIRCPIIPRGKNKVQLLINYLSYMFSADRTAKKLREDYDVVFSYQLTPILQVWPAIRQAKRKGRKLVMYNLDLAPMSGSMFVAKKKLIFTLYAKLSRYLMNSCDHIAVTSKSFIGYNHEVNAVPVEKMTYLPQHASGNMAAVEGTPEDNGIADFMFAGNIGKGTGLDVLVDAAERLQRDGASFCMHIVGDGSYLPTLKGMVEQKGLSEVFVFHGRHSMGEMPRFYAMADALLITLRPGQITVPGKLQTYMSVGRPIFGAMDGSGSELIEEAACGRCVPGGDGEGLYRVLKDYIDHPEQYRDCGSAAVDYFKNNFTLDIFMDRLEAILADNR